MTGSSPGLGLALARRLAEYGASIVLNGRDRDWDGEAVKRGLDTIAMSAPSTF